MSDSREDKLNFLGDYKTIPDYGHPSVLLAPKHGQESQVDSSSDDGFVDANNERTLNSLDSGYASQHARPLQLDSGHAQSPQPDGITKEKHSKRQRVRSIGHSAKRRSKHLVEVAKSRAGLAHPPEHDDGPRAEINNDPAFETSHMTAGKRLTAGGTADKVLGKVTAAGKAVIHPRSALKKQAATKIAVEDRPYLSQQADKEYLDAHADLSRAQSSHESDTEDEDRLERTQSRVEAIGSNRDGKRVAWVTQKHVTRVMVVPKRNIPPPKQEDFYIEDPHTGKKRFDWPGFLLAHSQCIAKNFAMNRMGEIDPLSVTPFDKDVLTRFLERILIASSPWQSFFLSLRKLYRWEDRMRTAKWAVIWFVIWYMDFVMTFVLSWSAYIVLENRFHPVRVETLRNSYERALGSDDNAHKFNELISRHGSGNWLDPLIDEAGPLLQMQLSDLADFLEILNNFYDWRAPRRTWGTLFWFATAIAIAALTPSGYSMKVIWMFCYLSFFVGRPVASHSPQYRHTVNALKWIFWEIPTDAEWSMMHLRRKAQETRAALIEKKVDEKYTESPGDLFDNTCVGVVDMQQGEHTEPVSEPDASSDSEGNSWHTADSSTSILGGLDLFSFRCRFQRKPGRLIIYSDGLRFVRSSPFAKQGKEKWRRSWMELTEMRKERFNTLTKIITMEGLYLCFTDDTEIKLEGVEGRDKAFNCIIGFSGLQFQVLQLQAQTKEGERKVPFQEEGKEEGQ